MMKCSPNTVEPDITWVLSADSDPSQIVNIIPTTREYPPEIGTGVGFTFECLVGFVAIRAWLAMEIGD